jgi:transposase
MTTSPYTADRLDDIPLLVGLLKDWRVDTIFETHLGTHGNTSRLLATHNGLALLIWLVYLLSAGDHRKVVLAAWVAQHTAVLSAAVGQPIVADDFSDDRLSTLLARLQQPACWIGIEAALFQRMLTVYDPGVDRLHLDATTAYGYHTPDPEGLMRMGFAKSGMPSGLAQVKLMAGTTARGQLVACAVAPGNTADSPLYAPLIERLRAQVGEGRLYIGDSKMATVALRADLAAHGDSYLVPLPRTEQGGDPADWFSQCAVEGHATTLLWRDAGDARPRTLLGGVWETTRTMKLAAQTWDERVLLVYSLPLAHRQEETLLRHVRDATQAIMALTRPPKRGRKQFREEAALDTAIQAVLKREGVDGLLQVTRHEVPGTGRAASRWVVTEVTRDQAALAERQTTQGWRVMVSNAAQASLSTTDALLAYREEYVVERFFHLLKDQPVGLRPFWVRTDEQIRGLAYLLTIAARVLTYIEHRVHDGLTACGEMLSGLHPGQPHIHTDRPTAQRLLETIVRHQPTRIGISTDTGRMYHTINITPVLHRVITLLGLPENLYDSLTNTS